MFAYNYLVFAHALGVRAYVVHACLHMHGITRRYMLFGKANSVLLGQGASLVTTSLVEKQWSGRSLSFFVLDVSYQSNSSHSAAVHD